MHDTNADDGTTPPRVLVAAASAHGATTGIADEIAAVLVAEGCTVTVQPADEVDDVAPYDAVVLGSAVYSGHWLDPARRVAELCEQADGKRKVWLFSSGPVGRPGDHTREAMDRDPVELTEVRSLTHARDHRRFAGRLQPGSLTMPQRALLMLFPRMAGDFREWARVDSWARDIAHEIGASR